MWSRRCADAIGRHLWQHRRHVSPAVQHCVRWQPLCSTSVRLRALPSHWGANKTNRKITVAVGERTAEQEAVLEPLRLAVREQVRFLLTLILRAGCVKAFDFLYKGDHVRSLKAAEGTAAGDVKTAVSELKRRKKLLEEMELQLSQNVLCR